MWSLLTLNVFWKRRLGGFLTGFWRLQGSILEPPKLDFNDFLDIWGRFLPSKSSKTCLLKSTMPKMPKRLKRLKSPTFFKVHRKEHDHKGLFYHRGRGKKGWAAVVPPWGFQSAGHRRCANGVLDWFPTGSVQSQLANLDILSSSSFAQFDLKCSFPYPFLSPGAWGPPQTRRQKAEKFGFFAFLVDFFAFRTALEKWYRKNIEKSAKIKDFGFPNPSQNPPEILPKSMFQKTSIFSELFNNFFLILKTPKPWKYQFYLGKITIFKVFAKIMLL